MTISIKALTELQELTGPDAPFELIDYEKEFPISSWCVCETFSENFTTPDGVAIFIN